MDTSQNHLSILNCSTYRVKGLHIHPVYPGTDWVGQAPAAKAVGAQGLSEKLTNFFFVVNDSAQSDPVYIHNNVKRNKSS